MARLTRQVGIRSAQVRLPGPSTAGPAIVKTALNFADQQFEKQADKRTQEAQVAAAALNFERDAEGNLSAPKLPIGDNGLLAPSIYDRAYTSMVAKRYVQQIQVDTSKQLNEIAGQHILDPDGYQIVAEAYVKKVTDLAPDMLKPDVNMTAQKAMVEQYNRISRNKAEFDWTVSRDSQLLTIDNIEAELASYAVANDPEAVAAKFIEHQAALVDGIGTNFWGAPYIEARTDALNTKLISAHLVGDISRMDVSDPVAVDLAAQDILNFQSGEGKVRIIRDGEVVEVDVDDAMPDPELRAVVADKAIAALGAREAAAVNIENARHQVQFDEFLVEFMQKAVEAEFTGGHADRDWLLSEFYKANLTENEPLKARIRAELKAAFPNESGRPLTELEKDYFAQAEDMMKRTLNAQDIYAKKQGVERFELLPLETQEAFNNSLPPLIGVFALPQTKESARFADQVYQNMAPDLIWQSEDQGGSDARSVDYFIRTQMQGIGLIPKKAINYFNNTLGNIDAAGGAEVLRVVSFFEAMRDTPNIRGKLKSALGEANFAALAFMSDHMLPSQIGDTALLNDVVERAHKGTLYDSVKLIEQDERGIVEEAMRNKLASYNDPWFGAEGAAVPAELVMEGIDKMPGLTHLLGIDPSDAQLEAIGEQIIEELVTSPDSRWRRDPLGFNADKARVFGMAGPDIFSSGTWLGRWTTQQPSTGYAEYPPIYWAELWARDHPASPKQIHKEAIMPSLQRELNKIQADVPLRAGQNVHLLYNGTESARSGEPAYEMYISVKGGAAEQITMDMRWNGEPVYFYPQEDVLTYREKMRADAEADTEERKARQKERDQLPMMPNDRGVYVPRNP